MTARDDKPRELNAHHHAEVRKHWDRLVSKYADMPPRLDTSNEIANVINDASNLAAGIRRYTPSHALPKDGIERSLTSLEHNAPYLRAALPQSYHHFFDTVLMVLARQALTSAPSTTPQKPGNPDLTAQEIEELQPAVIKLLKEATFNYACLDEAEFLNQVDCLFVMARRTLSATACSRADVLEEAAKVCDAGVAEQDANLKIEPGNSAMYYIRTGHVRDATAIRGLTNRADGGKA